MPLYILQDERKKLVFVFIFFLFLRGGSVTFHVDLCFSLSLLCVCSLLSGGAHWSVGRCVVTITHVTAAGGPIRWRAAGFKRPIHKEHERVFSPDFSQLV